MTFPPYGKASGSSVLQTLLENPRFSDLKFVCEGEVFLVHRAIVCTQSPVIDKMANHEHFLEGKTKTIEMDSFDHPTVKRMVEFMYTGEYITPTQKEPIKHANIKSKKKSKTKPPATEKEAEDNKILILEELLRHVRVNAIGDYYMIPRLRDLASTKVKKMLETADFPVSILADVIREAEEITADAGLFQTLAAVAAAPENIEMLVLFDKKFGDLDVMQDRFGGELLRYCALRIGNMEQKLAGVQASERMLKIELEQARDQKRDDASIKRNGPFDPGYWPTGR